MKNSGIVWDEATLAKYPHAEAVGPGHEMAFPGIASDTEVADLLAYLREAAQ